ncbi:Sodium/calcium exchanger protein-domain-containing protein [Blastocladiella britannica]|nr:Sodium/calcium exchanger protein-domain-containing protein [Blastocladiella britannica]
MSAIPTERTPMLAPPLGGAVHIPGAGEPTLLSSFRATFAISPINSLLIFVPIGIVAGVLGWSPTSTFWLNFLAIIPLAKLLSFATEELAMRTNQTIGGLLNATFGNMVELIVSGIALNNGLVKVVQSSLLGSILSNLLLVLGFCFFLGGTQYKMQLFNATAANTSSSLLAVSVMSLLVPAAYVGRGSMDDPEVRNGVLGLSRATSVILLAIYLMYLYFQLGTHKYLYDELEAVSGDVEAAAEEAGGAEQEEEEVPTLTTFFASALLVLATICIAVNSEFLVDSIEGFAASWHLPQTFVGLVLLPIVGNAAEHVGAVTFALKNKMDLALGIAVGSSLQIAILVMPVAVIAGWAMGQPMTLFFNVFDTCVLFISVLIVNYLIMDGKSNWLEGCMLLAAYAIIAIAFYMMPESARGLFM